jgi:hypothetical protein
MTDQERRELAETVGDFLEACGWHWCTECGKFHVTKDRQKDRPEESKLAVAYNEHRAALLRQPSEGREPVEVEALMRQLPTPSLYLRVDGTWSVRWGPRFKGDGKVAEGATAVEALQNAINQDKSQP